MRPIASKVYYRPTNYCMLSFYKDKGGRYATNDDFK
jgi:hypothetical protein